MSSIDIYQKTPVELELGQRRARKSMRNQIMMFALMIFLTIISFTMVVAYNSDVIGFSSYFIMPTLLLFAGVQVALQLYYFMHMNEKGHGTAMMFMYVGAFLAFLVVLTFLTIVWW